MALTFRGTSVTQSYVINYLKTALQSLIFKTTKVWSKSTPYTYTINPSDWTFTYDQACDSDNAGHRISSSEIVLTIKNTDTVTFSVASYRATLPTNGCTKCTIQAYAYVGYGTGGSDSGQSVTVGSETWDVPRDVSWKTHTFNVSGTSVAIRLSVNAGGDGWNTKELHVNSIKFS